MSATMIKEFRLPDLGEGLTESEILSWKVQVGDTVKLNQVIAEVETAKAVVELPSPFDGVIAALHEEPGTVVEVGKPIVSFEVPDVGAAPKREPNLVGYGAVVESSGRPARRLRAAGVLAADGVPAVGSDSGVGVAAVVVPEAAAPTVAAAAPRSSELPERPRSTPPVRKLAKDLHVDLAQVTGTGPQGLITRADVEGFEKATSGVNASAPTTAAGNRETRTPIKGVRKFTAAAMVTSAFTAPHVTEFLTVDVTPSMELLTRLRTRRDFAELRLTPLTLAAKAVLLALRRNPSLNSSWDEANQEIVTYNFVNLGIAAATPRGLLVPNLKDADALTLAELATALAALAETARAGKTSPADLSGGTISITNVGVFGIDAGTPILNPGEAAILALGAVRSTPWEYRGEVALRQVMTLSLSFDHRLVDGEQGARFLADVGAILADPSSVITMV